MHLNLTVRFGAKPAVLISPATGAGAPVGVRHASIWGTDFS